MMINIGLQSEYVLNVCGFQLTNSFLSTLFVTLILILGFGVAALTRKSEGFLYRASRVLVYELMKIIDSVTQDREMTKKVLPLIATFFIFIITANVFGLMPGLFGSFFVHTEMGDLPLFRSPNSDLTTTLALALFSVLSLQIFSLRSLGGSQYLRRFFNFRSPIAFILGFFEMLSEGVRVLSFSFRLFGNIFAGEILLLIIAFLVPYIIPIPFMILEVFTGVIQAFIFAMLTLTFVKIGMMRHTSSEKAVA